MALVVAMVKNSRSTNQLSDLSGGHLGMNIESKLAKPSFNLEADS
jgi:hypothetical protein